MKHKTSLNRELVFKAASELAEEVGLDHIELKQLAAKLNIRPPSLYNHISGLDEVYKGIATLSMQRLEDVIRDAAMGKAKEDALLEIAFAYRKFAKEHPELYKSIMKAPSIENDEVREAKLSVVYSICKVLNPYHLEDEDTIHFVREFRSLLHGFVSLEEAGFFKVGYDIEKSYLRAVKNTIAAIDKLEENDD
ncbi:MAG TPA: TetR family transcriptional regulator [Syntrophomonas sp.]|jgi:AcrR family transcriptional regulator|nr:TetR family transcriptional regulator [Syntrophomonas sp.]